MAQSRLTSSGGTLSLNMGANTSTIPVAASAATASHSPGTAMEVAPPSATQVTPGPSLGTDSEPLTADFVKNLIGENARMITATYNLGLD